MKARILTIVIGISLLKLSCGEDELTDQFDAFHEDEMKGSCWITDEDNATIIGSCTDHVNVPDDILSEVRKTCLSTVPTGFNSEWRSGTCPENRRVSGCRINDDSIKSAFLVIWYYTELYEGQSGFEEQISSAESSAQQSCSGDPTSRVVSKI